MGRSDARKKYISLPVIAVGSERISSCFLDMASAHISYDWRYSWDSYFGKLTAEGYVRGSIFLVGSFSSLLL